MENIYEILKGNRYPGRGIILGNSKAGKNVIAYFIMGRSENSRNRVFLPTKDGIMTKAFDESKLEDPSLIIYNCIKILGDTLIVTNGDQTDTIYDFMSSGKNFEDALRTRQYEPDKPNFTPRISGLINKDGTYKLSILKSMHEKNLRQFFEYDSVEGVGHFISTYEKNENPLPSFKGEPITISINEENAESFAKKLWDSLDEDNKISLHVMYLNTENDMDVYTINKNK